MPLAHQKSSRYQTLLTRYCGIHTVSSESETSTVVSPPPKYFSKGQSRLVCPYSSHRRGAKYRVTYATHLTSLLESTPEISQARQHTSRATELTWDSDAPPHHVIRCVCATCEWRRQKGVHSVSTIAIT